MNFLEEICNHSKFDLPIPIAKTWKVKNNYCPNHGINLEEKPLELVYHFVYLGRKGTERQQGRFKDGQKEQMRLDFL